MKGVIIVFLLASILVIMTQENNAESLYIDVHVCDCYTAQGLDKVRLYIQHFNCGEQRQINLEQVRTDRLGRVQIPVEAGSFLKRPIQIVAELEGYVQKTDTFTVDIGKLLSMCLEPEEPIRVMGIVKNNADNSPLEGVRIAYWLNPRGKSTFRSETCTHADGCFKWSFGIDYLNKIMRYRLTKPGFKSHKGEITLNRENDLPIYLAPRKLAQREGSLGKNWKVVTGSFAVMLGSFIYFSYYHDKD